MGRFDVQIWEDEKIEGKYGDVPRIDERKIMKIMKIIFLSALGKPTRKMN